MKRIDGKSFAKEILIKLKAEVQKTSKRKPGLAVILVGNNSASKTYVKMKIKACQEVGIHSEMLQLSSNVTEEVLIQEVDHFNNRVDIDGILVQQPLPQALSVFKVVESIDPAKDVDGLHPLNMGKLLLGEPGGFTACTPLGIVMLLEKYGVQIEGKHVVVMGRSNIVGKPLAAMLIQKGKHCNATVTIVHNGTSNLNEICRSADILVVAIGKPQFIDAKMVKEGAIVVDVGINHTESGLVGDVDFDSVKEIASMITPVPGGVGPMTIAMLLSNTYASFNRRCCEIR